MEGRHWAGYSFWYQAPYDFVSVASDDFVAAIEGQK